MSVREISSTRRTAGSGGGARLRVAFLPERIGANLSPCASIRMHPYFDALRQRGEIDYRVLYPEELERYRPHVIAWHRISVPSLKELQGLQEVAGRLGAKLLYDLDDNLLDMDSHGEGEAYRHMTEAVSGSLKLAHDVWCSTPALGQRVMRESTGSVHALANALDPATWDLGRAFAPRPRGDTLRLLYMGTRTHEEDFAFLSRVMEQLHHTHPGAFSLTVIGIRHHDRADASWLSVRSPQNFIGASYPGFVHWLEQQHGFDVGVAPLVESDFNACKSHIKVLDYAAIGLPTVASAVPAYLHALRDGQGCRLVPNSVDDWCAVLTGLRSEPEALDRLARESAALVGPAPFEAALQARRLRLHALARPESLR